MIELRRTQIRPFLRFIDVENISIELNINEQRVIG